MRVSVLAVGLTLAALSLSDGHASTMLTKQTNDLFGGGGHATVSNISNHPGISASAGGFRVNDGTANLVAWCLDTFHFLNLSKPFETTNTPFEDHFVLDATQRGNLQTLFDKNYSDALLASNVQSAGFQMALWEIIYEASGTALNVTNGTWFATASAGVVNFANSILGNLGTHTDKRFNLTFYQQDEGQNLVSASVVPLPAAGGMLALGLIGLYGTSRRKRATRQA